MIKLSSKDWEINNIQTVIFDKDGTFIDLHFLWGKITELRVTKIIEFYKINNIYFDKLCLFLGYDINTKKMLPNGITAIYSRSKIIEIFKNNLAELNILATENEIEAIFDKVSSDFYKNIKNYIKPIDEAVLFIKKLHEKGVKLAIVTSDSVESTNIALEYLNIKNLFEAVIGRESCNMPKESGFPTKLVLEKLSANYKTTLMIGDAPTDYESATNAGIENVILVSTGQVSDNELKKYSNYTVKSLKELSI